MRHGKKALCLAAMGWAMGFFVPAAQGTVYTWNNAGGGFFSTSSNWTPGGPPGAADTALFQLANTYTVTFSGSPTNTQLNLNDGSVTFNLAGQTYAATNAFVAGGNASPTFPRLTVTNGTFSSSSFLSVGGSIGNSATFILGPNGHYAGPGNAFVGSQGAGTMLVQSGATFAGSNLLDIGDGTSGLGVVSITDPGSTVSCGFMELGTFGAGTLNITGAGVLNCTGTSTTTVHMAYQSASSSGQATVSGPGATWNVAGQLIVAETGTATVLIANGGHLVTTGGAVPFIGDNSTATGTVSVSGAGSVWDAGVFGLQVGVFGRGELDVTSGAVVNSAQTLLAASSSTSFGVANVGGSGSIWNCSGGVTIGNAGAGSVTVSSGGVLNAAGNLLVNTPVGASAGVLTMNGGTVVCGSFTRLGTFNFNDGTLIVRSGAYQNGATSSPLVIDGNTLTAVPTVVITGQGSFANVANLTVGNNARGRLMLNDTTDCNVAGTFNIGATTNGSGTVIVGNGAGFATLEAAGLLGVGTAGGGSPEGSAFLQINQGGSVSANGGLFLGPQGIIELDGGSFTLGNIGATGVWIGGQFRFNSGKLIFNGNTNFSSFFADLFYGPDHLLSSGQVLVPGGTFTYTSSSPMTLNGGRIAGDFFVQAGSFTNASILTINDGAIDITGGVNNNAGALITLGGTGRIRASSGIFNNGTIVMAGGPGFVAGSNPLVNNGTLRGTGNVNIAAINNGQVLIGNNERLEFGAGSFFNSGAVSVISGEADFDVLATTTATGSIVGHDNTLRFNAGLTNAGSLLFTSGQSDVFGAITNNSGGKIIVSGGGTATFYNAITNNAGAELRVSVGGTGVFFGAVNGPGTVSGSGLKIFENGSSSFAALATGSGSTLVEDSASVTADSERENALTIVGRFTVRPNGTTASTSRLNTLTIDGATDAWNGVLDLNDNALIVDYSGSSPLATIANQLKSGYSGGTWKGNGIMSSSAAAASTTAHKTALGYAEATDLFSSFPASFRGDSIDNTAVLIRYVYAGDANLDGVVDTLDFNALAGNFGQKERRWTQADFNYDGVVDTLDFNLLASNFGQALPDDALSSAALVPEPATAAAALVSLGAMLACRRRRRA